MSDVIPLHLVMTSEIREGLHMFAVSYAIVRLLKVVAFGENAANVDPFTLRNRSSYYRVNWVTKA